MTEETPAPQFAGVLKATTLERTRLRADASRSLDALFAPAAVAVVGASEREGSVGRAVFANLQATFTGRLIPVNPTRDSVLGTACVPRVADIADGIDLAVVAVPAAAVPDTVAACAAAGARAAVVLSAGFKEVGAEGAALEARLQQTARDAGIAVLGPNCLGVMNTATDVRLNASFASALPRQGTIALMSQSGALCTSILDYSRVQQIGFSKFISFGNKADVDETDLLYYLAQDDETRVVLMYLEDLVDAQRFIHVAREVTGQAGKPILAIKTGRTAEGAAASASHTGALAGTDEVYEAILRQAGVLRVDTVQELFELAQAFGSQPMPKGRRVAIVTNAGGPGIMATDACVRQGLQLAQFGEATQDAWRASLPASASLRNPVDVIGDARSDRYQAALTGALADDGVDSALVILTPQSMTDIEQVARVIVDASAAAPDKPVVASFMGGEDVAPGIRILRDNAVPHYPFPENGARALGSMASYSDWVTRPRTEERVYDVDRKTAHDILRQVRTEGRRALLEAEAARLLVAYGLPLPETVLVSERAGLAAACERTGFPVVLKLSSPDILHKTDVGGVILGLQDLASVEAAWDGLMQRIKAEYPEADVRGATLQSMARKGREFIMGGIRDARFGPLIMFGLGGVYAEALQDVEFRLAPVRPLGALRMLDGIRGKAILGSFRGDVAVDRECLADCLQRLSQLMLEFPDIAELDMNPVMAYPDGACVVDARVVLVEPES